MAKATKCPKVSELTAAVIKTFKSLADGQLPREIPEFASLLRVARYVINREIGHHDGHAQSVLISLQMNRYPLPQPEFSIMPADNALAWRTRNLSYIASSIARAVAERHPDLGQESQERKDAFTWKGTPQFEQLLGQIAAELELRRTAEYAHHYSAMNVPAATADVLSRTKGNFTAAQRALLIQELKTRRANRLPDNDLLSTG
jgi:hypothetical protein